MQEVSARLQSAIDFSLANEVGWSRDTTGVWGVHQTDPAPYNRLYGPVHPRGGVSGVIRQGGQILAQWGEPARADLTFSVAKAYLALIAGLAFDDGLLDPHQRISDTLPGIPGLGFDDEHNRQVTWHQMLQQTSEWSGTCFEIPDQVDHYRSLTFAPAPKGIKGQARPLQTPGTYWEYNDVRINQLSLALLHLFRRPLPEVFRERITEPAGLSSDWKWVGYDHAWITLDGKRMPSVPGGSHWGAGVSISALDQSLIAELMLHEGLINGKRVLSTEWFKRMQTPCELAPYYGYLVWLNHNKLIFSTVPETSYFAFGAGGNFTWVEPTLDLTVVVRWLNSDQANDFFGKVMDAIG